jgi:hypothetical protein
VSSLRLERALAAIDAANADDPNTIEVGGVTRPKELAHAELMTAWIERLVELPSDAQRTTTPSSGYEPSSARRG